MPSHWYMSVHEDASIARVLPDVAVATVVDGITSSKDLSGPGTRSLSSTNYYAAIPDAGPYSVAG